MDRFLVFSDIDVGYEKGFWTFQGSYPSVDDAKRACETWLTSADQRRRYWFQIVDGETRTWEAFGHAPQILRKQFEEGQGIWHSLLWEIQWKPYETYSYADVGKDARPEKYILFAGLQYEQNGGIDDLEGTYPTLHAAQEAFKAYVEQQTTYDNCWAQIVLRSTMRPIRWGYCDKQSPQPEMEWRRTPKE